MISHSVETPRGTGAFFLYLASSPPDKGGYFPRAFISFSTPSLFNPLALRALPLYSLTETPRNTTGHGRGED